MLMMVTMVIVMTMMVVVMMMMMMMMMIIALLLTFLAKRIRRIEPKLASTGTRTIDLVTHIAWWTFTARRHAIQPVGAIRASCNWKTKRTTTKTVITSSTKLQVVAASYSSNSSIAVVEFLTSQLLLLLLYKFLHFINIVVSIICKWCLLFRQDGSERSNPGWHPRGHAPLTLSQTSPCEQFPHVDMQSEP